MDNRKDVLPIVMASAAALVITGVIRWMIPGGININQQPLKPELSLPDIPLMIKTEQKKVREVQVLVTKSEINKDERINQDKLSWKAWPANAVQPSFIAQDNKGIALNNKDDYANALNMWAKHEIGVGVPVTLSMLTSNDPIEIARKKKEAEDKLKSEEEKKKQEELKKKQKLNSEFVGVGYRAVSFQVDQRTPVSNSMISPGDYVDILINSREDGEEKTHVYEAIKLIAVDGVTQKDKERNINNNNNSGGIFGNIGLSNFSTPKNVTLEVKEKLVNTMLKQASNNGVVIVVRNQHQKGKDIDVEEDLNEEINEKVDNSKEVEVVEDNSLDNSFWEMSNRHSVTEILRDTNKNRREEENQLSMLLHSMNAIGSSKTSSSAGSSGSGESSAYELVSGRIVKDGVSGDGSSKSEKGKEKDDPVSIYRKKTVDRMRFYKDGKLVTSESEAELNGNKENSSSMGSTTY